MHEEMHLDSVTNIIYTSNRFSINGKLNLKHLKIILDFGEDYGEVLDPISNHILSAMVDECGIKLLFERDTLGDIKRLRLTKLGTEHEVSVGVWNKKLKVTQNLYTRVG